MKIPGVNHTSDATKYLSSFSQWENKTYKRLNVQIIAIFIGISDPHISNAIYQSQFGKYPKHNFQPDLDDLVIWTVLEIYGQENEMFLLKAEELMDDPDLVQLKIIYP